MSMRHIFNTWSSHQPLSDLGCEGSSLDHFEEIGLVQIWELPLSVAICKPQWPILYEWKMPLPSL
jgi:hypothetical protein